MLRCFFIFQNRQIHSLEAFIITFLYANFLKYGVFYQINLLGTKWEL